MRSVYLFVVCVLPIALMDISKIDRARFESKVHRASDGCWIWTAAKQPNGYGVFKVGSSTQRAHRVAFAIEHGREPTGYVLHSCDVKACVNPDHLREGTQSENIREFVARGKKVQPVDITHPPDKARRGESNGQAKLTTADVEEIRSLKGAATQREIARRFGVTHPVIGRIHRGEGWT